MVTAGCRVVGCGYYKGLGWDVQWNMADIRNLQLQWHSLAARVIADFPKVRSAKYMREETCIYKRNPNKIFVKFFSTSQLQNILIVQLSWSINVFPLFLIKLNPNMIITIMPVWFHFPFVAIVHHCVIQVHKVRKSTKVWHAKCLSKQDCTFEQTLKFYFSSFRSFFSFLFFSFSFFLSVLTRLR